MKQAGFTLIEVIVALAIVSILLVTLVTNQADSTQAKSHMMHKMAADIAAKNALDVHRLVLDDSLKTAVKPSTEEVEVAGYTFRVEKQVLPAALPGLKKIVVDVYAQEGTTSLRTLDLYVGD